MFHQHHSHYDNYGNNGDYGNYKSKHYGNNYNTYTARKNNDVPSLTTISSNQISSTQSIDVMKSTGIKQYVSYITFNSI